MTFEKIYQKKKERKNYNFLKDEKVTEIKKKKKREINYKVNKK